jgi:uncharacterized protein (DUF1778 family)|tara:strand:- start:63 stop:341 length:279 start_codon:yes stop_codon:yes gene_type:complete
MPKNQAAKEPISLRIAPGQRTLIDRAADACGKNRTDFMVEAAYKEAESVLLDRRHFALDEQAYSEFESMLNAAPMDNERLKRMLNTKAPWET